jgi:hypothetical protein
MWVTQVVRGLQTWGLMPPYPKKYDERRRSPKGLLCTAVRSVESMGQFNESNSFSSTIHELKSNLY